MLQIRPTEIKAIANLLEQEHDDVEALAKLVIQTIDELRAKRETFVLAEIHPTLRVAIGIGPYATEAQARKDVGLLVKHDTQSRAYLLRMKDPSNVSDGRTLF
jgi:hypothetical protein